MTGVTKAVECTIFGIVHIKDSLLLIGKSSPLVGFPSCDINGPLSYVRRHLIVKRGWVRG